MSTDDLTDLVRRARETVGRMGRALPNISALVSELADEVDRLREAMNAQSEHHDRALDHLTAERDAARAALERVKDRDALAALIASVDGLAVDAGGKVDGFHYDAADAILNALEGES